MKLGTVKFKVFSPSEHAAGLRELSDEVTIWCDSGQWGGEPGEFAEYMRDCLFAWYDGASVTEIKPETPHSDFPHAVD